MVEAKVADIMAALAVDELGMTLSEMAAAAEGLILPKSQKPSGFKHVTYNERDKKWRAKRWDGYRSHFLGNFDTADAAALCAARWRMCDETAAVAAAEVNATAATAVVAAASACTTAVVASAVAAPVAAFGAAACATIADTTNEQVAAAVRTLAAAANKELDSLNAKIRRMKARAVNVE